MFKSLDEGAIIADERLSWVLRESDAWEGTLERTSSAASLTGGSDVGAVVRSAGWAEGVLSVVGDGEVLSLSELNSEAVASAPSNGESDFVASVGNWGDSWVDTVGADGVEFSSSSSDCELSFWLGDVDQVVVLVSASEVEGVWSTNKDDSTELSELWSDWVDVGAVSRSDGNVVREVVEFASLVHVGRFNKEVVDVESELVPGSFLGDVDSDGV